MYVKRILNTTSYKPVRSTGSVTYLIKYCIERIYVKTMEYHDSS